MDKTGAWAEVGGGLKGLYSKEALFFLLVLLRNCGEREGIEQNFGHFLGAYIL